jgi:hypothetical protein
MEDVRSVYKVFVEKYEEVRPFGSPARRLEDNVGTSLKETWWEGVDWTGIKRDYPEHKRHGINFSVSIRLVYLKFIYVFIHAILI